MPSTKSVYIASVNSEERYKIRTQQLKLLKRVQ